MGAADFVRDEELYRAHIYALLARLLAGPLDNELLDVIRGLESFDDNSEIGLAIKSLGALATRTPKKIAEEEYTELFYGVGAGGELSPYASFYLTGLVYSRPLANLRKDLEVLGITSEDSNKEPEDHIASLCEVMHGLISGSYGSTKSLQEQKRFFNAHIAPWGGKFFVDLEGAKAAALYMPVGTIGKLFLSIERDGFEMVT